MRALPVGAECLPHQPKDCPLYQPEWHSCWHPVQAGPALFPTASLESTHSSLCWCSHCPVCAVGLGAARYLCQQSEDRLAPVGQQPIHIQHHHAAGHPGRRGRGGSTSAAWLSAVTGGCDMGEPQWLEFCCSAHGWGMKFLLLADQQVPPGGSLLEPAPILLLLLMGVPTCAQPLGISYLRKQCP
jgi:hypothetical protein